MSRGRTFWILKQTAAGAEIWDVYEGMTSQREALEWFIRHAGFGWGGQPGGLELYQYRRSLIAVEPGNPPGRPYFTATANRKELPI